MSAALMEQGLEQASSAPALALSDLCSQRPTALAAVGSSHGTFAASWQELLFIQYNASYFLNSATYFIWENTLIKAGVVVCAWNIST